MADAVTADIVHYGPETTVALTVSHGAAEDLADRVRRRLADTGALTGPAISGPGWTTDRHYQAGDRVLLHTRHGDRHSALVNGTVGTITAVDAHGVMFRADGCQPVPLPAAFVQGVGADGSRSSSGWLSLAVAVPVAGRVRGLVGHLLLGEPGPGHGRVIASRSRARPAIRWPAYT